MRRPVVRRSIEEPGGARCVDLLETGAGFHWVECRRDPEDSHGWRHLGAVSAAHGTERAALEAARAAVDWMERT